MSTKPGFLLESLNLDLYAGAIQDWSSGLSHFLTGCFSLSLIGFLQVLGVSFVLVVFLDQFLLYISLHTGILYALTFTQFMFFPY